MRGAQVAARNGRRPGHGSRPARAAASGLTRDVLPLRHQLANVLRSQILTGEWAPGSRLPTEDALARRYRVSRLTVRAAKAHLEEEGLIRSVQGSGSYLAPPEAWRPRAASDPGVESLDDFLAMGRDMLFKIREFRMTPNTREVAETLDNAGDRFVFQISGLRFRRGHPISHVVYYLPFDLGARIPPEALTGDPFIPQFEKLAGIRVADGRQTIHAGRADAVAAEHLGLRRGAPVLVIETVYFDAGGRPVEFVRTQYREDFRYSVRLRRAAAWPASSAQGVR